MHPFGVPQAFEGVTDTFGVHHTPWQEGQVALGCTGHQWGTLGGGDGGHLQGALGMLNGGCRHFWGAPGFLEGCGHLQMQRAPPGLPKGGL